MKFWSEEVKPPSDFEKEFIELYKEMMAENKDLARLKRLEVRVDKMWATFDQSVKDRLWMTLYPEQKAVKEAFGGHAESLNADDLFKEDTGGHSTTG